MSTEWKNIVNLKFGIRFHILDYLLIATDGLWHMQESRSRFRAFAQSVNFDSILTAFRISAILMGSKWKKKEEYNLDTADNFAVILDYRLLLCHTWFRYNYCVLKCEVPHCLHNLMIRKYYFRIMIYTEWCKLADFRPTSSLAYGRYNYKYLTTNCQIYNTIFESN